MILVFDLDDTLCKVNKKISNKNTTILKKLSKAGNKIVIASGKPLYYLSGLVRQAGIYNCILIAENGSLIQYGIDLPPKIDYVVNDIKKIKKQMSFLKKQIENKVENIWFQPNEVCLTPFPKNEDEFKKIKEIIKEIKNKISDVDYFIHFDSIDFIPKKVNKKTALEFIKNKFGVRNEEFIVIGNSINDYPMFEFTQNSIGINLDDKDKEKAKNNFKNINEALNYLINKNKVYLGI